jgi:hypothetical protein
VQPLEQFPEEFLRRLLIPTTLHENIQGIAVRIDRPPQIVPFAIERQKYFIQVPFVAWPRAAALQLLGILLAALAALFANGFVGDEDVTDEQEFFHIAMAERKAEIPPDGVADDFTGAAMMFVRIGWGWSRHGSST